MTAMNCGCKIISGSISFDKAISHDSRITIFIPHHNHQQYINVCGNCERKANLFNNIEKTKLNLAKKTVQSNN